MPGRSYIAGSAAVLRVWFSSRPPQRPHCGRQRTEEHRTHHAISRARKPVLTAAGAEQKFRQKSGVPFSSPKTQWSSENFLTFLFESASIYWHVHAYNVFDSCLGPRRERALVHTALVCAALCRLDAGRRLARHGCGATRVIIAAPTLQMFPLS